MTDSNSTQPELPQENVTLAATVPQAPPLTPTPNDDGRLQLVKKIAQAFRTVITWEEDWAEACYYVVAERSTGLLETFECRTKEELRECVHKLRAQVCQWRRNREPIDMQIRIFHGVRFQLQKWPCAALVHGKEMIPLDPLEDLAPVIDTSGSLWNEPSLINRSPRRSLEPSPNVGKVAIEPRPVDQALDEDDESDDEDAGLPPDQDPVVIG